MKVVLILGFAGWAAGMAGHEGHGDSSTSGGLDSLPDKPVCVEAWRHLLESMTTVPDLRAVRAPATGSSDPSVESVPAALPSRSRTDERESTAA